jgi:pimeloyl-ACP methyl ester carboxylesterase
MTATVADYAELNGVRTYYEIHGEGPPLLLLHGGFCPVETMAGLIRLLAERYRVYFPERRAHGRTADVAGPITYDIMAQDTIAFMGAVGLSEADVVGWSDGATVGLLVALRRPDLVKRLVHIGQQLNPEGLHPQGREMLKRESMPTEGLPPMLKDLYAAVSPDGPEHWDAVVDKLWRLYRTEPNRACQGADAGRDRRARLPDPRARGGHAAGVARRAPRSRGGGNARVADGATRDSGAARARLPGRSHAGGPLGGHDTVTKPLRAAAPRRRTAASATATLAHAQLAV